MTGRRDTPLTPIQCRARITPQCMDGKERKHWRDDGTYDMGSDSIVCDPCYIMAMIHSPSGQGLNEELPDTIRAIRRMQNGQ